MTVQELIDVLEKMPKHKIVIICDDYGWDNIEVTEEIASVKITFDENHPFDD